VQLLWRAKTNQVLPVDRQLADGSYLSRIYAARDQRAKRDPIVVRVVEYALGKDPGRHQQPGPYRLLITILDPEKAPRGRTGRAVPPVVGVRDGAG
jgi:hypothetical protein